MKPAPSLLGQHALGYVLVTYLSVRLSLRMTPEAFLQQLALLFAILGVYLLSKLMDTTGSRQWQCHWVAVLGSLAQQHCYLARVSLSAGVFSCTA